MSEIEGIPIKEGGYALCTLQILGNILIIYHMITMPEFFLNLSILFICANLLLLPATLFVIKEIKAWWQRRKEEKKR